ncbi:peptide/nickel transport system permease protein [Arthrobacter silviterrae]|uniref:ABC transporter permease n=1 Tax=Arthrobacter silviterrae TaxID=2026658 RepID=A0ABX0DCG6_9MICC|nr:MULTISPECIES: ABC transporter permease [Arthrobacter]MCU6481260.1 ABC transporter permease [Arthrobacter sp. A2-55]MDQ0276814.1 peptide/nickel transport system permease protein [Arthrobacter silviterrae]NGN83049.1 ABC transporter permease [Arthrobacter silviterrae]
MSDPGRAQVDSLGEMPPPEPAAAAPTGLPVGQAKSMFQLGFEVFIQNKLAIVGMVVLVLAVVFCFVGPLFYHTDQVTVNLLTTNLPPGPGHPLGTDETGYDQLGRLMVGGQASLTIGFAAAIIATIVGTVWGAIAGFFGGLVDAVMMRVVDAILSIPILFLLLFIVTIVRPSIPVMIFVLGLTAWLVPARLVRGESLTLRVREYVQAVRVMGGSSWHSVLRHIMPNVIGTVIVNATFQVADAILLIAYLGYLGLGISPPATDWGGMLSNGTAFIFTNYWWLIYPPGILIIVVVVAVNLVGDGLRDSVEVRLQRR